MAVLFLQGIQTFYGSIQALRGIALKVEEGEIVTLIGGNGAGKSTTLMTICGVVPAREGTIHLFGKDITRSRTKDIVKMGVSLVPEGRHIFSAFTTLENLHIGSLPAPKENLQKNMSLVYDLFPILAERRKQIAGTLSGGEQQMLAIGRALMAEPKLLLLDEPSLGLAPLIIRRIFKSIATLNQERGLTVLLIEQNAHHALSLAHRGYVIVSGSIELTGSGRELLANPEVQAAYLEGGKRRDG